MPSNLDFYDPLFVEAGQQYGVDPRLLKAQAQVESGGNPTLVSPAGAGGLMQIMPDTARGLGVANPFNPRQSIFGAAKLMSQNLSTYGSPEAALMAYDAGPNQARWNNPETQSYVPKIVTAWDQLFGAPGSSAAPPGSAPINTASNTPAPSAPAAAPMTITVSAKRPATPAAAATTPASTSASADPSSMSEADLNAALLTPPKALPTSAPNGPQAAPGSAAPAGSEFSSLSDADLDRQLRGQSSAAPPQPGQIDPLTGRPVQSMSAAPDTPLVQSLGKPIAEGNVPGVGTQIVANLPTDPEARRRVMASQLFPGLSPMEAQSRVFYAPGGRLAAVDANGNAYYVDPDAPSLSIGNFRMGNPLAYAASGIPGAIPAAAGIAAGALTGPGSLVVGPAAAAIGAGAADIGRQYLARAVDPSTTPVPINLGQTAQQAALSGAGQFAGGVVANALAPNALRLTPAERRLVRPPAAMQGVRDTYANAAAQGVPLTPGQATGLPSLLQYEDAATTMPQSVDTAANFYQRQGNALQGAGQNMLASVSPVADKNAGAAQFQQGAEDAIRLARQNANAAARPAYQAAQAAGQVMSPDLAQLAEQPAVANAMEAARNTYQNLYRTPPPDTPDFALWDLTKRQLDDAHTVAQRAGNRTDATAIDTLRGDLRTHLDAAYPSYAHARATAAPGQQLASQLEDSGVGAVAGKTGDERARAIVAPVFAQNNPRAIAQARDAFAAAGRTDEWNAGVRSYVQDAFDRASMSMQGLNPATLRRQVWSNEDNRAAIQAAMTPAQYQGFDNFLSTVENVARTYPMNSLTATRLNARGALAGAAESQPNVRMVDAAATVLSPFRWADVGTQITAGVRQRMIQKNMNRIVGRLFSPDGLQMLEAMSRYSPGSLRAVQAGAQIVTRALPELAGPAQPEPANQNPLAPPVPANPLMAGVGR